MKAEHLATVFFIAAGVEPLKATASGRRGHPAKTTETGQA